ncbi:transposase, partial [Sporolactobacillus sp. THM19-2]|uniref:transposase n=1 Tax=Sporolactobacillus sp. THM19-2 TaxID=2511171 RepID=UPI0010F0D490
RKNRAFCKARHIRLSGPKLGRRPKDKQARKTDRRVEQCDFKGRIPVEGKFGQAKRRFGLDKIYAMLRNTSETVIALKFLVLNLERRLRASLRFFMDFTNVRSISAGFPAIFRPRAV